MAWGFNKNLGFPVKVIDHIKEVDAPAALQLAVHKIN
jgi:hypothetical protein